MMNIEYLNGEIPFRKSGILGSDPKSAFSVIAFKVVHQFKFLYDSNDLDFRRGMFFDGNTIKYLYENLNFNFYFAFQFNCMHFMYR